jgi:seryl-tRNA(Sec) selenium transferase
LRRRLQRRRLFSLWIERLAQQDSQLGRPVHERQAQPLQVRIACAQLRFDGRNLPAALPDSCRIVAVFRRDFFERASITIQRGLLPA